MKNEVLRLDRVTLTGEGGTLLDGMNLHLFAGEICGLVCINSHGQDALIRLICQNLPIRYGYVYYDERLVNSYRRSPMDSNRVSVIEERSRLVGDLTVADNIFVLRKGFQKMIISPKTLAAQFALFTGELGVKIDANARAADLPPYEKCVVELLRAVIAGAKLVILRDLSNFISVADLARFRKLLRRYAAQGIAFLYVCSHHEETFRVCDRVALMEDGKILKVMDREQFRDETALHFALDFCRSVTPPAGHAGHHGVLKFRHVETARICDMSFVVEQGECVVLLDKNNTTLSDIMGLMLGDEPLLEGEILLGGEDWNHNRKRLGKELCFIRENPLQTMLFPEMSYLDNLCFTLDRKQPLLWMNRRLKKSIEREYEPFIGEDIYEGDISRVSPASLYNLVYYRVHLCHPKVVFCAQPFAGADMYQRHHILRLIRELRDRKIAVVILAVSLSDCLVAADRLLMIEHGRLQREYRSEEFRQLENER